MWEQMTRDEKIEHTRNEEQKEKQKKLPNKECRLQEAKRLKSSWKDWREQEGAR